MTFLLYFGWLFFAIGGAPEKLLTMTGNRFKLVPAPPRPRSRGLFPARRDPFRSLGKISDRTKEANEQANARSGLYDAAVHRSFSLSGNSSSITVTAPPVASWMRRARTGDGLRFWSLYRCVMYEKCTHSLSASSLLERPDAFCHVKRGCSMAI